MKVYVHPIAVHFTNALLPVSLLFLVGYIISGKGSYLSTYFHVMIIGVISIPFSYITGLRAWKKRYKGARVRIFIRKNRYSAVLSGLAVAVAASYMLYPGLLDTFDLPCILFLLLNFFMLPCIIYLGYLGGRIRGSALTHQLIDRLAARSPLMTDLKDQIKELEEQLEALIIAIPKEEAAYHFYRDLAQSAKHPGTGKMFLILAEQELVHKQNLETMLRKYRKIRIGSSRRNTKIAD